MRVTFLGGADEIGASCTLLELAGRRVLVDCGVRMGGGARDPLPDLRAIQEAGGLDAIVLTHAHLDHTGALPLLHANCPEVPVFATAPTLTLLKVLLLDAVKIMGGKLEREGELPLYSLEAVEGLLARATPTRFLEPVELAGGAVTLTHFPAGHVLGASAVALECAEGRVFVSGDLSITDQLSVPGMLPPRLRPDLAIVESTYGDRMHANRQAEERRLAETVAEVVAAGGKVLIPAFALGRAQEVLLLLRRAFSRKQCPEFPVWVDGMVRSVCEAYAMHPEWVSSYLRRRIEKSGNPFFDSKGPVCPVERPAQRAEIAAGPPCCIVSSSGMLSGGPSPQYAAMLAPDPRNLIAITGYQDEESPGRALLDLASGASRGLRLGGETVPVACRVARYSLSAHADGSELAALLGHLRPRDVVLVHGEGTARPGLARGVAPRAREGVYLPGLGDALDFSYRAVRPRSVHPALPGFGPGRSLDAAALAELARGLGDTERRLYDARELAERWGCGADPEFRDRLRAFLDGVDSPFEADARRPFLYRVRREAAPGPPAGGEAMPDAAAAAVPAGPLDQTALAALVDAAFPPPAAPYRKSLKVEECRLELCFDFPAAAKRAHRETLERLAASSGWQISVYPEVRLSSLLDLARRLVPPDWELVRAPGYRRESNLVLLQVGAVPPDWRERAAGISATFEDRTGVRLDWERGEAGPAAPERRDASGRLEVNQAMAAIERLFESAPHRPGKLSRKTDGSGPLLEAGFISPAVASLYGPLLERASLETGWRVVAGDRTDQAAILSVFRELWPPAWPVKKGPSLHVSSGRLAVTVQWMPPAAELAAVAERLRARTGFTLEALRG